MNSPELTDHQIERVVIACIAECSGIQEDRLTADSDLIYNGIAGDDGRDIIDAIRTALGAKLDDYDFYPHFGPEAAFSLHTPISLTVRQLVAIVKRDLDRS
jgi:hypothetical protein